MEYLIQKLPLLLVLKLAADYAEGQFGNGAAGGTDVTALELSPPAIGDISPSPENLEDPLRSFENISKHETPDDWDSEDGREDRKESYDNPTYRAPGNATQSQGIGADAPTNVVPEKKVDSAAILSSTSFPMSYRLSKNYVLGNFIMPDDPLRDSPNLKTSSGLIGGGSFERFTIHQIVENLAYLAENIGEPLFEQMGPALNSDGRMPMKGSNAGSLWRINSGFRTRAWPGGSDHGKGRALDYTLLKGKQDGDRSFNFNFIKDFSHVVPYHQCILEYRKPGAKGGGPTWQNWIHMSIANKGNAKMGFTMLDDHSVDINGNSGFTLGFFLF